MEAANTAQGEDKPRRGLGRCLLFFWLGVSFNAVGASVLLMGVFTAEPYWDVLLYLGACCFFLSLLWWVCWYSGNLELGPEDAGSSKPFPLGLAFLGLAHTLGQSLAFPQTSTARSVPPRVSSFTWLRDSPPWLPTHRSALLSQAIKAALEKARSGGDWPRGHPPGDDARDSDHRSSSQRADRPPGPETGSGPHRGAESWCPKRPYTHPGKVMMVQPLSPTLRASPKRLPLLLPVRSLGSDFPSQPLDAALAVPGLPPGSTWPGQPQYVLTAVSMPSLSESAPSCPLRIVPSRSHPSLWPASPPRSPSLLAAQRYLRQLCLLRHQLPKPPPSAGPTGPTSLRSHLETTHCHPPPPVSPNAGAHLASLIPPSSRDSSFVHKTVLYPKAQQSQRPGSRVPRTLSPEGREPTVCHPCSLVQPDESPGLRAWGPKVST